MHFLSTLRNNIFNGKKLIKNNFLQTTKRSFRPKNASTGEGMKLAPKVILDEGNGSSPGRGLVKSYFFTAGFCGVVFAGASIWQHEKIKKTKLGDSLSDWVKREWNVTEGWDHKEINFRKRINMWWNNQPDGRKIFWGICAVNLIVFACWHHPAIQRTMYQYFCTSPAARAVCWPMFLSTFSHYSFLHVGINMYVLHSFSNAICNTIGAEQFIALYCAGGIISSLASASFKVAFRTLGPSLGASGAIMAFLGFFCTQYPDAQLGVIFLPQFPFSADSAIKAVICLDALGIILRWKLFDHAAHLGGVLFGILYAKIGQTHIWPSENGFVIKSWEHLNKIFIGKEK